MPPFSFLNYLLTLFILCCELQLITNAKGVIFFCYFVGLSFSRVTRKFVSLLKTFGGDGCVTGKKCLEFASIPHHDTAPEVSTRMFQPGLPLSFLNWVYVRQGVYFWAYGTPGVSIFGVFRTPSLPIFGVIFILILLSD